MLRSIYFLAGIVLGLALGRVASSEEGQTSSEPKQQAVVNGAVKEDVPVPASADAKEPAAEEDDFTVIDGIGPAFAEDLQRIGIRYFSQLAEQDPEALAAALNVRVTAERIRRDRWIEQAEELAQKG